MLENTRIGLAEEMKSCQVRRSLSQDAELRPFASGLFMWYSRKKAQTRLVGAQTALIIVYNHIGLWVGSVLGGR